MMDDKPKKLIEASLFLSQNPISAKSLAQIAGVSEKEIEKLITELKTEYADRGVEINQTPAGWQIHVKTELINKVSHLSPYSDLSEGVLKTLALVVYKHPATQSYLVKMQGNKVYNYIKKLEIRGMIKAVKKGRTKEIYVTQEFENYFGTTLDDIKKRVEQQIAEIKTKQDKKAKADTNAK
ncbi:MAG: SMC-Scp complex subunit ScpB [Candidatus Aenigmarchaeota archaeon]|nr:SMC-Scp complex subunit ScpB [Candidatus Aenigmarchaeota archaeon]